MDLILWFAWMTKIHKKISKATIHKIYYTASRVARLCELLTLSLSLYMYMVIPSMVSPYYNQPKFCPFHHCQIIMNSS